MQGPRPPVPTIVDFPEALARGIALFNKQKFFEAHEVWEDRWRIETAAAGAPTAGGASGTAATRADPGRFERAVLLHGLIQIAAGFVKWQRGEPGGMASLLAKGADKLRRVPGGRFPVDLDALLAAIDLWRRRREAMPASGFRAAPGAGDLIRIHPAPLPGKTSGSAGDDAPPDKQRG